MCDVSTKHAGGMAFGQYSAVTAPEGRLMEKHREEMNSGSYSLLSPVENGGASRGKMAARGIEGLSGLAPGEPGNGIG